MQSSRYGPELANLVGSIGSDKWDRPEVMYTDSDAQANAVLGYVGPNFKKLVIINTPDGTDLTAIDPTTYANNFVRLVRAFRAADPSITLFEVINESDRKNAPWIDPQRQNPAKYAAIYVATIDALRAAGITKTQCVALFSGVDPLEYASNFTAGWIPLACTAQPTLAAKIEGISTHPYGEALDGTGQFWGQNNGWKTIEVWHQQAIDLGIHVPWYVTEVGSFDDLNRANLVNRVLGDARDKYPWIRGLLYYQAVNDGTGTWGLFTNNTAASAKPGWDAWRAWIIANTGAGKVLEP